MRDHLVLDASAALAFLRGEPRKAEVSDLLARHLSAGGIVIVPELFWLEIINVQVRRHALPLDRVLAALRNLDELGLQTVSGDRGLTVLGLDVMLSHGLSAYDAAYLALAIAEDADLLTVDRRLALAAGERSLLSFPREIHETREPYQPSSPMDVWAAHGAYLSELRRQAEAGVLR